MATLQFADFVWPNNPETYRMTFQRDYSIEAVDGGTWSADQGSRLARKFECEGVFYGESAYENFSALAALFMNGTSGQLVHPQWEAATAFLAELEVLEEPCENLLRYRILFVELPTA